MNDCKLFTVSIINGFMHRFRNKNTPRRVWIVKLSKLPLEIWNKIATVCTLVSAHKLCSTCRIFYDAKKDWSVELSSEFFDEFENKLQWTTITHLITNIPYEICRNLEVSFQENFAKNKTIILSSLQPRKADRKANNYLCYEFPSLQKCKKVYLEYNSLQLVADSSRLWKWQEVDDIFKLFELNPLHSSHVSSWTIPEKFKSYLQYTSESFTVIYCTGPLIF